MQQVSLTAGFTYTPAKAVGVSVLQQTDLLLGDHEALRLQVHNEQRPAAASTVCEQPQLL